MKEYKNEIEDILVSNRQLAVELQFDLRQHDKQEAAEKAHDAVAPAAGSRGPDAAAAAAAAAAEPASGGKGRVPLTPLSIPRLNSASKADDAAGAASLRSCAAGIEPRTLNLTGAEPAAAGDAKRECRQRAGRAKGVSGDGGKARGTAGDAGAECAGTAAESGRGAQKRRRGGR